MRRGLAWVAGALGLAALLRALKARRPAPLDASPAREPDPADELRAALAEHREHEPVATPDESVAEPLSLEERRQRVHERAQEAIDSMRGPDA